MKELVDDNAQYQKEIANLKQIIHNLEAVNVILESQVKTESKNLHNSDWVEIRDQEKIFNILTSYHDSIKKLILEDMAEHAMTVPEIIQKYDLPQASTYRKVTELIDCGLIIKSGFFLQNDSKRVYKYVSTIKNMRILFNENKMKMLVLPAKKNPELHKLCEINY